MSKLSKVLFAIWMVIAVVSFVASFWAPLLFKIIGLTFGGLNMLIILSLVITYFQGLAQARKLKELEKQENGM